VIIEQATLADLPVILAMRTEASAWLAERGIDQWTGAWPTPEAQTDRILSSIRAGETWMVRDDNEATAATVALDTYSDPQLWAPDEQTDPSMYLHRLIVRRKYAGLGDNIIDWACRRAGQLSNHWVRIDVWTDNTGLHRYYARNGFRHVRTLDLADYPSGALSSARPPIHAQPPPAATTSRMHPPSRSSPDRTNTRAGSRRRCRIHRPCTGTGPTHSPGPTFRCAIGRPAWKGRRVRISG
jgi:RimJ/RimL family protein N-acetyltransferase